MVAVVALPFVEGAPLEISGTLDATLNDELRTIGDAMGGGKVVAPLVIGVPSSVVSV